MLQIKSAQNQSGLNIQAFLRDFLMSEAGMPIQQAQGIADAFAKRVEESDWLELSNGLTFEKKFDPKQQFSEQERQTGIAGPDRTVNPFSHMVP